MKKLISLLLALVTLTCGTLSVSAKIGDDIGDALHTDIGAYINHYPIPSYAVNGTSVVVAEDLRQYGFNVDWNGEERSLRITRNTVSGYITPIDFKKSYLPTGSKFADILETDIKVYADDTLITSYAMNGYTMVPMEELTVFGEVVWIPEVRALKMWVDGLPATDYRPIEKESAPVQSGSMYYPGTNLPDYGLVTGAQTDIIGQMAADAVKSENSDMLVAKSYVADADQMYEYFDYLERDGWYLYEMEIPEAWEDPVFKYYYIKGVQMVGIFCDTERILVNILMLR